MKLRPRECSSRASDGAGSEQFPNTRYLLNRLPEIINAASGESPVQVLLVTDANPLYTLPDTAATKKALRPYPVYCQLFTLHG